MKGLSYSGFAIVIAVTALALPTAAAATQATIGSDLKGTPGNGTGFGCGDTAPPCAIEQTALPGDPHPTRAPFNGELRKWRFRTTFSGLAYKLRLYVVRKTPSGKMKFVERTKRGAVGPDPGTYVFRAKVPVKKGDYIALGLPAGVNVQQFYVEHPGATDLDWFPVPPLGQPSSPTESNSGSEFFYNATIRR